MLRWAAPPLLLTAALHAQPQEMASPVTAEFRVFAARDEITAQTRLRVMPTGRRDETTDISGRRLTATLPAGIYDVQAFRTRQNAVVGIKWAERLVIMHYPDEGGRHLEVINFETGFGALQLRAEAAPIADYDVTVFPSGERGAAAGVPFRGEDYVLYILEAGRYDIRVRRAGTPDDSGATDWLLNVEVPADRTRLKRVDAGG